MTHPAVMESPMKTTRFPADSGSFVLGLIAIDLCVVVDVDPVLSGEGGCQTDEEKAGEVGFHFVFYRYLNFIHKTSDPITILLNGCLQRASSRPSSSIVRRLPGARKPDHRCHLGHPLG